MGNRKEELINTLQHDLSPSELIQFYQSHHIVFERVDLFRDFAINLTKIIASTYLGDAITPPEKQITHFKWCWKKNISDFEKEHIYFAQKGGHYQYFIKYFMETYYMHEDKDLQVKLITEFWAHIMSYLPAKRTIDLGVFLGLYELLNKNLVFQ